MAHVQQLNLGLAQKAAQGIGQERVQGNAQQPVPVAALGHSGRMLPCLVVPGDVVPCVGHGVVQLDLQQGLVHQPAVTKNINEPRREKTGLRGFRPGLAQTGLYSFRKSLED